MHFKLNTMRIDHLPKIKSVTTSFNDLMKKFMCQIAFIYTIYDKQYNNL